MNISVIGIDIAKAVFYLVGINEKGCVIYRVKVKRAQLLKTLANIPVCVVAMEACESSNYWAREIGKLGFEVKLLQEPVDQCRVSPGNLPPSCSRNRT